MPSSQVDDFLPRFDKCSFSNHHHFDYCRFAVTHLDPAWIAIMGAVWLLVAFDKHRFFLSLLPPIFVR
jgi:hypothetical protein